ncbi:glycosyltransferase family 4 protein [Kibdelosporangium persicum]|uniref:Glycosyltransferase involved in cell wall biosynthesis n=1 Tax=Kibdelosporangium persicum TaxID=2698649 RepID=A0ABX2FC31_9PSEU|nr:glycosyltransferase family 4 protein [Kibdelosporangium persicum]NRN68933.1 Glycosyltransferase involved in cell wall biosynthesis [Kibdelosporangium persicum]
MGELPAITGTVAVITFVVPGDIDDQTVPSGGNVYDRRMSRALGAHEVAVAGTWPTPDEAARQELASALADLDDGATVLIDGLVACGVPEVVVPQAQRLRIAVLVHLPLADETGLEPDLATELNTRERETLHAAGMVIATSPWAARRIVSHHWLDADRVHAVPPGTDPAPLAPGTDGRSRLLCVAAVTQRKGQDRLVEALAEVRDLRFECELVGSLRRDTDYVLRLHEMIKECGLADRVTLAGPKTGAELEASYAAADLFVLPSHTETYGMVLTEALARGIPVLATRVSAMPETVGRAPDGTVPGILTWKFADALRRFLTDAQLRDGVRAAARARRETLTDWDAAARELADVLADLEEPACRR